MFGDPVTNPMGWDSETVSKLTKNIVAGQSVSGEARQLLPGEKAVLKISAVTYGYFKADEYKVILNPNDVQKAIIPQKGDLLFSRANTREMVGATALVEKDYPNLILPDKLWKLILTERVSSVYLKFVFSSQHMRKIMSNISTGTGGSMFNISMEKLRGLMIPLPPLSLQNEFAVFVKQVDKSKFEVQKSLEKLKIVREQGMSRQNPAYGT
jgi:type I restriction enzyme S subunit